MVIRNLLDLTVEPPILELMVICRSYVLLESPIAGEAIPLKEGEQQETKLNSAAKLELAFLVHVIFRPGFLSRTKSASLQLVRLGVPCYGSRHTAIRSVRTDDQDVGGCSTLGALFSKRYGLG